MTRYEKAARLFHPAGGSWFVRTVGGKYLYLAVDLTTRDLSLVKNLKQLIPESWIVLRPQRGYASWRLTQRLVTYTFLKALLPLLPAAEQLVLAEALGRTVKPVDSRGRHAPTGALLRRLRQRQGLTQKELARRATCIVPTISSHELGRSLPSAPMALRLELALQAPGLAGLLDFHRRFRWRRKAS